MQKYRLKESEEKQRSIIEHSTAVFYSHTLDNQITFISPQVKKLLDCEPEEAMTNWTEFATNNPANETGYYLTQKAIETGLQQPPYELELIGKKGRKVWVEVHESPVVKNGSTVAITGSLTDITARKQADEKISKLNRIYRVLSQINQTIVRTKNEQELFEQICKILVENGNFKMVWVGELDYYSKSIKSIAQFGDNDGYLKILTSFSKDILSKDEPFFRSLSLRRVLVFNNLQDELNRPWRKESVKRGYKSYCIIPLLEHSKRNLVLNLYSTEQNFFNTEEIELLTELAEDISFSLNSIEQESLRIKAEEEVVSTKQMLEKITSTTPAYISVYNIQKDNFLYTNGSIIEQLGYSPSQIENIHKMNGRRT